MTIEKQLAFIGAGNMASALIEGLVQAGTCAAAEITASDLRPDTLALLAQKHDIHTTTDNADAVANADVVMLCVKPQNIPDVLPTLASKLRKDALVVSIAAGVPTVVLEGLLPKNTRVVRAMPNTPALVQAGATGLARGSHATKDDLSLASTLFHSVGVTIAVEEALIDAVTGVSGSGPAYVFRFVEALEGAAIAEGLSAEDARTLAVQTVFGAAKLLAQSGEAPSTLRAKVTSKGGTTAAGLASLEQQGFENAILSCVRSATARGRELGQEAAAKAKGG